MNEGDGQPRLTRWNCENDGHEWAASDGGVLCTHCRRPPTGADVLALAGKVRALRARVDDLLRIKTNYAEDLAAARRDVGVFRAQRDALKDAAIEMLGMF